MNGLQNTMVERLRPLVGSNGWDYCILWSLSPDQRYLEWMGCCCSGGKGCNQDAGFFPAVSCRDMMFQHPATTACEALAKIPTSIPLDSSFGSHAQVLISDQHSWKNNLSFSNSDVRNGTKVLIPVPGGLVELFVSKEVTEDQQTIDFVMARCNTGRPQTLTMENQRHRRDDLHWDLSSNPSRLYASHLNLLTDSRNNDVFFKDSTAQDPVQAFLTDTGSLHHSVMDSPAPENVVDHEKEFVKHETARAESGSEGSEQAEDDEELRPVGRGGKRHHQSKNLEAERKRRKKLNDRLYNLRALVPKITKMDRASILGDAIGLVMELQKQVKDLQDELEDIPPDNDVTKREDKETNPEGLKPGLDLGDSPEVSMMVATNTKIAASMRPMHGDDDNGQQMEPQVEVRQLDSNEFYLKVFCEHKQGGFARLLEAMNSLELEVTNVNVTTFRKLVLNIFKVEKRNNEEVQADQVRDSLLELTRNTVTMREAVGDGGDYHHRHHHNGDHHGRNQHHLHYLHH